MYVPVAFRAARRFSTMAMSSFSVSMRDTCTFPWGSRSMISWRLISAGRLRYKPAVALSRPAATKAKRASSSASALNSLVRAAIRSFSLEMRTLNSGMNSIKPSGMSASPKFSPFAALATMDSHSSSVTWSRVRPLDSISSEIKATFGRHCKAHSRAIWLADRPISFMKCQYFLALLASRPMLPISSE